MGVGFIAGTDSVRELMKLVGFARTVCGLTEIRPVCRNPDRFEVMLCFENKEDLITCQWMLEALGAEGREPDGQPDQILPERPEGHDG